MSRAQAILAAADEVERLDFGAVGDRRRGIIGAQHRLAVDPDSDHAKREVERIEQVLHGHPGPPLDLVFVVNSDHELMSLHMR